ncbi:hypothetical protein ACGYLO_16535 [Sulfitobacter sp. 1A13353]|uniref:hypothetical protein n=1 Tax=Sulfitobacter sp. 1A13353 TaxID=3368568 RepID=UPI00374745D2
MTYHIRHHTTQAHIKASTCAPVFTMRNEPYPEHYEAAYAKAMKALTAKEGHMGRAPVKVISSVQPSKKIEREASEKAALDAAILKALSGEMCTDDIAAAVSKSIGSRVSSQLISGRMRVGLAGKVTKRRSYKGGRDITLWSLSREPHVSCKDRIAAAKREAAQ